MFMFSFFTSALLARQVRNWGTGAMNGGLLFALAREPAEFANRALVDGSPPLTESAEPAAATAAAGSAAGSAKGADEEKGDDALRHSEVLSRSSRNSPRRASSASFLLSPAVG